MPPRPQLLMLSGALAVGVIVGSLATAVLLPAIRSNAEPAPKAGESKAALAHLSDPVETEAVLKPDTSGPPGATPPVATGAPKADTPVPVKAVVAAVNLPPIAPAVAPAVDPPIVPPPPGPGTPSPDDVLRKKGLKRSGVVYVLDEEEVYTKRVADLDQAIAEWEAGLGNINAQIAWTDQLQLKLAALQRPGVPMPRGGGFVQGGGNGPMNQGGGGARPEGRPNSPERGGDMTQRGDLNRGAFGPSVPPLPENKPFPNSRNLDKGENPLFQNANPRPSPSQSPSPSQNKPEVKEPPHHQEEKSTSKKLFVVLPRTMRPQVNEVELFIIYEQSLINYSKLVSQAAMKLRDIRWRQAGLFLMARELEQRYAGLDKDPEVMAALEEMNKTAIPKFTLGPRPAYKENLEKMTVRVLNGSGFQLNSQGNAFRPDYITYIEYKTKVSEEKLNRISEELRKQQRAWQDHEGYRKDQRKKAIDGNDVKKIAAQEKEAHKTEEKIAEFVLEVATAREVYVQNVTALRRAVDEAPQKIAELKKGRPDLVFKPIPPDVFAYLAKAEKTLTRKVIALEPDKTLFWIPAAVNGKPAKMVLDPGVKEVRMSAEFAASLGITSGDDDVTENIVMEDGQELRARRLTLDSVQVGPFKAEKVDCLAIIEGFDAPPVLGASFLNHYAHQIDPESGNLTLTRVDVKPPVKKK